jgi:type I restriction enzyme S subunit
MVVEKGYKQTDIGIIPEGWQLRSIDEVFDFYSTSNFSKAQMQLDGEVGCLHYGLIHAIPNCSYDLRNGVKYFVDKKQAKYELLKEGDVVMVDASEDLIGVNKSVEISGVRDEKFIAGLHTFLLRDKGFYQPKFRGAILNSSISKTQMLRLAVGMKVFGVSKPQLKTILLPVPPLPEQTAIANALSDMDALIAQTEKLIEKKKAIKQGVMQELLKPKEGWVTKKLGEVCIAMKGKILGKSDVNPNGKYDCILYGELFTTYKEEIFDIKSRTNQTGVASVCDDILFPGSTTTSGIDLAKCSVVLKDNVQLGGDIVILRKQTKEINSLFVAYYLNQFCKNEIAQSTRGITIHHLYGKDLVGIKIKYPELTEQLRIVNSILDIEYEVEILIKKLQKLKHQKQGMMQALLTGKIRLI